MPSNPAIKQYELVLVNEKEKIYRVISILLLMLNFLGIFFLTYIRGFTKWGPLILSLSAAFSVFAGFYFKKKNEKITFSAAFFFFSLAWMTAGYWLPFILNELFLLFNAFILKRMIVLINDESIVFPSLFKREVGWSDLSNLMLKDDLLTIDFKNNKLIQKLLDKNFSSIDENKFNEFCKQQLKAASSI